MLNNYEFSFLFCFWVSELKAGNMIQVTLQILNAHFTSGNYPPRSYRYVYEIRSFWSKVVQIPATDCSGKTVPVSLSGLTTDDYERKKTHGEDVMICIEVYAEPLAAEYLSRENKKRVGVAMLPISYAIARPHVNPLWEVSHFLPFYHYF